MIHDEYYILVSKSPNPRSAHSGGAPTPAPDVDPVTGETEWACPVCGIGNFYKRFDCYRCHEKKPVPGPTKRFPTDWICPACNGLNFSKRTECFMCSKPKPENMADEPVTAFK